MLKYKIPQIVTLTPYYHIWRVCKQKRLHSVKNEPFSLWTSLGLNQGPPDYESFCVVFHVITWDVNMLIISDYWILWFAGKYVHLR